MKLNKAGEIKYIIAEAYSADNTAHHAVCAVPTTETYKDRTKWLQWCRWFSYQLKDILPSENPEDRHALIRKIITRVLYEQFGDFDEHAENERQLPVYAMREMLNKAKRVVRERATYDQRRDLSLRVALYGVKVRSQNVVSDTRKMLSYITVPDRPKKS